jgi:hypothetical protein
MSELLKKYESLDQSKLNEGTIKILNRVKTITADFTADDAKNNKIAEDVLNEVMKKNPNAVKIVKRTPKAKTAPKKTHKATHTTKGTHTTSSTAKTSNNIMSVTKEIQKAGESWKDAMERAKAVIKERKEKVVQKQKTELEKLYNLVKTKKELQGFANSDIRRDSVREAKVRGARFVTKEGNTSNKYGTFPNKLGRKYWETRDRHADRLAPNYPKDMPLLASGGAVSDAPFSVEVFKTKLRFDNELTSSSKGDLPTFAKAKEFAIDMIDNGNYYAYIVSKNGYLWGVDSKGVEQFADGGMMDNMSIHNSTDFFNTPVYAKGGGLDRDTHEKEVKFLKAKKFTDIKTTDYDSTVKFGNTNNDEVIFASIGKKDDGYGKTGYGIAYFYQNEDNGVSSISREILDEIASLYNGSKVELFTNAGVDLHSTNRNMYKNIYVRRVPYDRFDSYADGGSVKKVNLGSGEMDLEDAIKIYEDKIKAQGRVTNERDEDILKQLKRMRSQYADGGTMWTKEMVENEISHYKNLLRNIDKYPNYNKKNVEKIIAEYEEKLAKNEFAYGGMTDLTIQNVSFAKGGSVDVVKGAIKVGIFSKEDLKTGVFEKALDKKSKETGLTNIDLKTIVKGDKIFIELYLIPNKSDNDVKIKDWYLENYPTDDLGEELNDEVTFEDMWNEDYEKYNIYEVMGVGDSVIRERLFEHLAEIKGVSYDVVYRKLFSSDGFYAKGGGVSSKSTFRANNSPLLEYANFKDGSHINLIRFNPLKRDGTQYKSGYKFVVSVQEFKKEQQILSFKTLEKAKEKFDTLVETAKSYKELLNEGKTSNYANGGSLPFMTDPNFGNFQNTGAFEAGGELKDFEQSVKDALKVPNKWHFITEDVNGKFVQLKMFVGVKDVDVQIFKIDGVYASMPKNYAGKRETLKMIMNNFNANYELGGAFMTTDLAGHSGGGTGGLNADMPLSGVSGTYYTGLVGETGAMSSGELFMDGGAMAQNQQVINDASQSYVNYYLNDGGGVFKDGGSIPNNYKGRTPEDVWDNFTISQKEHFVEDHFNHIPQFLESGMYENYVKVAKENRPYKSLPKNLKLVFDEHISMGQYAKGGSLGKALYVEYSSYFTYNNYDEEKIMSVLESIGAKNIRLENDRGWFNQPEVVVFNGDKNKAQDSLNEAFDTDYIRVSEKDWRTKKMADGGFTPDVSDGTQFMSGVYANGGSVGDVSGNYYSTTDFVSQNDLMDLAKSTFGQDWESGGDYDYDTEEIKMLVKKLGGGYKIVYVDSEQREKFENAKSKYLPLLKNKSNDGDIFVIPNKKMAYGGFTPDVSDGTQFMSGVYANGGGIRSQEELNKIISEKDEKVKGLTPKQVAEMWNENSFGVKEGISKPITVEEAKSPIMKMYLRNLLIENELTEDEYNEYFESGGFVGTVEFNTGDVVWQKDEKRYATVMNNYGDAINGDGGEIRLDTTGNTMIFTYDPKTYENTGYNLVKLGQKGDTGKFTPEVVAEMKESANRLIDSRKERDDTEMIEYYEGIYKRLLDGEFDSMTGAKATASSKLKKYIDNEDINYVALMIKGSRTIVKGSDVLNGANLLKDGGDLTNIAFYVPKRDVISVTLKNGKTITPVNGYWVKKDYQPISGSGGNNVDDSFKIGDYVKKTEKQGSIVYGTEGFIYEIDKDFSEIKLEDDYGNKNPKSFKLKGFRKLKSKSKNANVSSNAPTSIVKKDSNKLVAPKGYVFVNSGSHRATQQINRGDAKYVSLYSFGGANTSAGTTIMFMTEKDFEKVKDIRGVSPAKNYLPAKSQWFSRHEDKKLDDVFLEIEQKESFGYADGGFTPDVSDGTQFMSGVYANGGGFANDPFYKAFMEKRDKLYAQLKSRVVRAVGIDEAMEFFDYEYSNIAPYKFIERAVQSNLIALDEINKELVDSAIEEAREIDNDEDLEEIGSSDFTYYLKSVLDNAGFKVGFVNDRLQRLNEDGSIKEISNNFADGGFMNDVYADGGEVKDKDGFNLYDKLDNTIKKDFWVWEYKKPSDVIEDRSDSEDYEDGTEKAVVDYCIARMQRGYIHAFHIQGKNGDDFNFVSKTWQDAWDKYDNDDYDDIDDEEDDNVSSFGIPFDDDSYAKGGGVGFKPYGNTKGKFKITYIADGKKQSEIRETLEMAIDTAKRYKKYDEFSKIEVFDESGKKIMADGGIFEDNDGFMRADNNKNYRYPEKEVYIETLDEPIDLTSTVTIKSNEVVITPIDENIDLNDDNRVRARMTQSSRGTAESFSKINPRAFEFIDLPMPTSNTHKND